MTHRLHISPPLNARATAEIEAFARRLWLDADVAEREDDPPPTLRTPENGSGQREGGSR